MTSIVIMKLKMNILKNSVMTVLFDETVSVK